MSSAKTTSAAFSETEEPAFSGTLAIAKGRSLTVAELLAALTDLLKRRPEVQNRPVMKVELGSLIATIEVDVTRDGTVVIT